MTIYFVSNAGSGTAPYDTEAKAAKTLAAALAVPATSADLIKVSATHVENAGAGITLTLPTAAGLKIVSVTFDGSGTGAAAAGGAVNTNGNFALTFNGFAYIFGVNFSVGAAGNSSSAIINIGSTNAAHGIFFESCNLFTNSSNAAAIFNLGPNASTSNRDMGLTFKACTFRFGGTGQFIQARSGRLEFEGLVLNASGSAPTSLFAFVAGSTAIVNVNDSKLDDRTWTNFANVAFGCPSRITARQCKMPASFVVATGSFSGPGGIEVELIDCDSGDNHYTYLKSCWCGTIVASNAIYADASNGTDSISWHMTGNANTSFAFPLVSPPITTFNATLSVMTATIEAINDGTTFTDAQLWQETSAKVTSGSTRATVEISDRAASIIASGSNQTTSTKTWTGTGGFSSAVKQKLVSGSFTPAEVGSVVTVVKLAANDDVYISPKVALA